MKDFQGYRQKKNNEFAQQKAQRLELRNGNKTSHSRDTGEHRIASRQLKPPSWHRCMTSRCRLQTVYVWRHRDARSSSGLRLCCAFDLS